MAITILQWLQRFYQEQANGDWEHTYGIKIETVDNPGWWICIDLADTDYADLHDISLTETVTDSDWYFYRFANKQFTASGDLSKLEFLLCKFREQIEKKRALIS
jgi:hypothetical protein